MFLYIYIQGVVEIRCRAWDGTLSFHLYTASRYNNVLSHMGYTKQHFLSLHYLPMVSPLWARQLCEQIVFEVYIPPFLFLLFLYLLRSSEAMGGGGGGGSGTPGIVGRKLRVR